MNPFNLDKSIDRSVKMLNQMMNPKYIKADKAIPATFIRHCEGIAFLRIYKAGFLIVGGNIGGGCVIAKVPDESSDRGWRWSAPASISCGGLGGGFVVGGESIDSIVILNTKTSVRAFMGKGQVTLGGNVSLAVGPVGKDIEAHVGASSNKEVVAAYSYSNAKGAYVGGSLEGAFVARKDDENKRYYGSDMATAENLITGKFPPPFKCMALANELDAIIYRRGAFTSLPSSMASLHPAEQDALAKSGRDLVNRGLSSDSATPNPQEAPWATAGAINGAAAALPADWQELRDDSGTAYYYNSRLNITQWERPQVPTAPPVPVAMPVVPKPVRPVPVPTRPAVPARPTSVPKNPVFNAVYEYKAVQPDELSIKPGDKLELLDKVDANWWKAKTVGGFRTGLVPCSYLEPA